MCIKLHILYNSNSSVFALNYVGNIQLFHNGRFLYYFLNLFYISLHFHCRRAFLCMNRFAVKKFHQFFCSVEIWHICSEYARLSILRVTKCLSLKEFKDFFAKISGVPLLIGKNCPDLNFFELYVFVKNRYWQVIFATALANSR